MSDEDGLSALNYIELQELIDGIARSSLTREYESHHCALVLLRHGGVSEMKSQC